MAIHKTAIIDESAKIAENVDFDRVSGISIMIFRLF